MGTWQSTMTLFYSLEQVVSFKEGTFPENMLFQGFLIPESSMSQKEIQPGFRVRERGERARWGASSSTPPDSWFSRIFMLRPPPDTAKQDSRLLCTIWKWRPSKSVVEGRQGLALCPVCMGAGMEPSSSPSPSLKHGAERETSRGREARLVWGEAQCDLCRSWGDLHAGPGLSLFTFSMCSIFRGGLLHRE